MFHNESTYDYHFIIKELVKEFEGNFECLGESTEKYITFSVPIKKKIENKDLERKNEKLLLKCFSCDSYYEKKFNKELIKKFKSTYSFCNNDLNKFILLLRKGVYPYEHMDTWVKFNEIQRKIANKRRLL